MKNSKPLVLCCGKRVNDIKHCKVRMQCSKLNQVYYMFSLECPCDNNLEYVNLYSFLIIMNIFVL